MKKRFFSLLLMALSVIIGVTSVSAQGMPQLTPLPEMPGLRTGKLPNGLTYYVLHNEKPKGRANFYIAQKVGSTLETPEQLGLAHFLEHMAFNGTKNYPGKTMLNYLQNKGIRFGDDINAYTDFDETVYNLDNIPTSDVALMDSVLLVLRDWSCDLLLEDAEIEAERGVIQEEWRSRNDASDRMFKAMLPVIFEEYQYKQSPIGTMEVVMNFKPEVLRDYYHSWYRPDQQGIVVVGDFDAEEMEKKIIDLFSPIPMPENAPERTYAQVSDNKEPIYFEFEDPELKRPMIMTAFKTDRVPFEMRNTLEMYVNNDLMEAVITRLINNRLEEYSMNPDCDYQMAGCYFGQYYVAKTKEAFFCNVIPKSDPVAAYKDMMSVVARACKTGFTDSELERVNTDILSQLESMFKERDNTNTSTRAKEIIRHFVENIPAPGAEAEYQIASSILTQIPVEQVNMIASMLLTPENQVIVVTQPKADGFTLPGKESMLNALDEVLNMQYEAYVDEVITDPLLPSEPVAGKITAEKAGEYDTTEFTLSNGMKVVLKSTDFNADQILIQCWSNGGKIYYPASQASNIDALELAFDASKLGNFNKKTLVKYLKGKQLTLEANMGMQTFYFSGESTVKDFPTLMELLYASMSQVSPDAEQFETDRANYVRQLELAAVNPDYIFSQHLNSTEWGHNAMMEVITAKSLGEVKYDEVLSLLKSATANAADFTLTVVGNIDAATLRPLLEKYAASLPSLGKPGKAAVLSPIALATGRPSDVFDLKMQTPQVKVFGAFNGELPYTMANSSQINMLGDVLGNIYTLTLREEEGGTYSPGAFGTIYPSSNQWMLAYIFITNSEMSERLQERAYKEAMDLFANGAKEDMFNQVKEAAINQYTIQERTNSFWVSALMNKERGLDTGVGRDTYLRGLTIDKFNEFVKSINNGGSNYIKVVMNGVPVE